MGTLLPPSDALQSALLPHITSTALGTEPRLLEGTRWTCWEEQWPAGRWTSREVQAAPLLGFVPVSDLSQLLAVPGQ